MNITSIEREKQIELLNSLKTLTNDEESLKTINQIENELIKKKYGLVWEEHYENNDIELIKSIPVFNNIASNNILEQENGKLNFLLEGDNLQSLSLLQKTHSERVDVIYIDPPYNTGNKDFKYDDNYVDKLDLFKHSKWLSFMEKRLNLARTLLNDNGVIFISIDDYEYANLKLICDEIFGETNLVTTLIWQRKTGASDAKGIATISEYILVYTKSPDKEKWDEIFYQNEDSYDTKRYIHRDQDNERFEQRGPYYIDNLDRGGLQYSDSMNYGIECPDGTVTYPNGRTAFENDGWTWKWGENTVKRGIDNGFIEFHRSKEKASGWAVKYKNYLKVDRYGEEIERAAPFKNIVLGILNGEGTAELNQVVGKKKFNNPKPLRLIKFLLKLIDNKNATVLDFFAGSGTTGQAVLELNQEDGGERTFILSTNNENNICTEVTYPRIKNTIKGYEYNKKTKKTLYEKKLTLRDLRKIEEIEYEIEQIIEQRKKEIDKVTRSFKDGVYKVEAIYEKKTISTPISANLKYYKTALIDKNISEEIYLSDILIETISELIVLENFDLKFKEKIRVILDEDSKIKFFNNEKDLKKIIKVYKPADVFLTTSELNILKENNVEILTIPDYYYLSELRELGEL